MTATFYRNSRRYGRRRPRRAPPWLASSLPPRPNLSRRRHRPLPPFIHHITNTSRFHSKLLAVSLHRHVTVTLTHRGIFPVNFFSTRPTRTPFTPPSNITLPTLPKLHPSSLHPPTITRITPSNHNTNTPSSLLRHLFQWFSPLKSFKPLLFWALLVTIFLPSDIPSQHYEFLHTNTPAQLLHRMPITTPPSVTHHQLIPIPPHNHLLFNHSEALQLPEFFQRTPPSKAPPWSYQFLHNILFLPQTTSTATKHSNAISPLFPPN